MQRVRGTPGGTWSLGGGKSSFRGLKDPRAHASNTPVTCFQVFTRDIYIYT